MGKQLICNEHYAGSNPAAGSQFAPFVYRPVRHVLSVKRAVQLRYGVLLSLIIAWGSLVSRDPRAVEIVGSNPTAVTFYLGVVKFGITRRLGRRDRWFESSHLDSGAAIRSATEPVSKTGVLNRLVGSTPTRSAC